MSYLDTASHQTPAPSDAVLDANMVDIDAVTISGLPTSIQEVPSTPELFEGGIRSHSTPHEIVELDDTASEGGNDDSILHNGQLLLDTTPTSLINMVTAPFDPNTAAAVR